MAGSDDEVDLPGVNEGWGASRDIVSIVSSPREIDVSRQTGLEWTGERFIPGYGGESLALEHIHRYQMAKNFCRNRRVLDLGCGQGYGSATLLGAGEAASLVAMDISPDAVAECLSHNVGISGAVADATVLPFAADAFDVVVCFEVIEHVYEPARLVMEIRRVLAPGGIFLVSTPNKSVYNAEQSEPNPYHLSEMELAEFRGLLESHFERVRMYAQRVVASSIIWPVDTPSVQRGALLSPGSADAPPYVVALCSDGDAASEVDDWSAFTNWTHESLQREAAARIHIAQIEATLVSLRDANLSAAERESAARAQLQRNDAEIESLRRACSDAVDRERVATERHALDAAVIEDLRRR